MGVAPEIAEKKALKFDGSNVLCTNQGKSFAGETIRGMGRDAQKSAKTKYWGKPESIKLRVTEEQSRVTLSDWKLVLGKLKKNYFFLKHFDQ